MGVCSSKGARSSATTSKRASDGDEGRLDKREASGFGVAAFRSDNPGKIDDVYDVEKKMLGQGSYGSVFKARHRDTKAIRAVKSISKTQVKNLSRFEQEIAIMKVMDHPGVIKLFEVFQDHRQYYLIMELAVGGELFDRIIESGHFTESQCASIMQQILRAIYYMHSSKIMHRDLKPENFLFVEKNESIENSTLKIIDFGLSTRFTPKSLHKTKAGTPYYVAPQVLAGKYGMECDIWSIGVIMYVMLCGYPPFYDESDAQVLAKVRTGTFTFAPGDWKNISEDAKNLIRLMLTYDPADRVKAEDALSHIWIQNKAPHATAAPLQKDFVTHLRGFRSQNKLKKAALQVLAQNMDDSKIKHLRAIFSQLDKNGDGHISHQEMMDGISEIGDIPTDLVELVKGMDANNTGEIDYTEFLSAAISGRETYQMEELWCAFRRFDLDGNGKISKEEMQKVLSNDEVTTFGLQIDEIAQIIEEADANGDGEIDFDEFVAMMMNKKT